MLGRRIATRQPPTTCLPELRRALLDEWCNIHQDQIDNLISACLCVSWLEIQANLQSPKTPKSIKVIGGAYSCVGTQRLILRKGSWPQEVLRRPCSLAY
ncbi:hypothetical protein TNCV_1284541 [Trichonephila clavipes]|uniref:Uncharacterized protein n=1 Tax=Trichonephila clavipes TaxID=2585209 RepID=A0A8X6SLB4_TRICX|nr:hypothetical protein TNCV_1284541 [Trichonephila clavipes]